MLKPHKVLKVCDYIPYNFIEALTILFMYYKILQENEKKLCVLLMCINFWEMVSYPGKKRRKQLYQMLIVII